MLEAQLPEQETAIVSVRVSRTHNRLFFAQGDRGPEFILNPDIQKRIGFDAKVSIEGATLLPQTYGTIELGDELLLMVLVDREGSVMQKYDNVVLWLKLQETRDYLHRLAKSRLIRAYREDDVVWIGPDYNMPERFLRSRREVCRQGDWFPHEENLEPRRDASRIVSLGQAFNDLALNQ